MCRGNCFFIASASAPIDCSSGRFLPRRTALIQSAGSVPRPVAPSPAYPRIATPSVVSRNITLRASSFGGRSLKDRRRSASSQIDSDPITVTTSVTKCTPTSEKRRTDCRLFSYGWADGHSISCAEADCLQAIRRAQCGGRSPWVPQRAGAAGGDHGVLRRIGTHDPYSSRATDGREAAFNILCRRRPRASLSRRLGASVDTRHKAGHERSGLLWLYL